MLFFTFHEVPFVLAPPLIPKMTLLAVSVEAEPLMYPRVIRLKTLPLRPSRIESLKTAMLPAAPFVALILPMLPCVACRDDEIATVPPAQPSP